MKFRKNILLNFLLFSDIQDAFDRDKREYRLHANGWHSNATDAGIMGYYLVIQTGDLDRPVDRSRVSYNFFTPRDVFPNYLANLGG